MADPLEVWRPGGWMSSLTGICSSPWYGTRSRRHSGSGEWPVPDVESRITVLAHQVGVTHLLDRPFQFLSGGEKALVAFTTALSCRPELLVLDEFDSHLDAQRISSIRSLLTSAGLKYVVWCTQNMDLAMDADHLLVLHKGRVLHSGRPEEVFPLLKRNLSLSSVLEVCACT